MQKPRDCYDVVVTLQREVNQGEFISTIVFAAARIRGVTRSGSSRRACLAKATPAFSAMPTFSERRVYVLSASKGRLLITRLVGVRALPVVCRFGVFVMLS